MVLRNLMRVFETGIRLSYFLKYDVDRVVELFLFDMRSTVGLSP